MSKKCVVCNENFEATTTGEVCSGCQSAYSKAASQAWHDSHNRGGIAVRNAKAMRDQILKSAKYKRAAEFGNKACDITEAGGDRNECLKLTMKAIEMMREIGHLKDLSSCLGNAGTHLAVLGRYEEALAMHKEEEQICRDLGNETDLGVCYQNLGLLQKRLGNKKEAKQYYKKAIDILSKTKERPRCPKGS